MMRPPTIDELKCLITWPTGSKGYHTDLVVLKALVDIANVVGFGRMSQLAAAIEEIWRDPEAGVAKYEAVRKEHFRLMHWAYAPIGEEGRIFNMFSEIRFNENNAQFGNCNLCSAKDVPMDEHIESCPAIKENADANESEARSD